MRNRILIIAGIAALVIGATVLAVGHGFQGPGEHRRGPGHGEMLEHMARELGLTDAQKQQVKAIMEGVESSTEGTREKLEDIHKQVEAATANGQFDEATIRNLANQQAQLESDMMVEHLRAMSKMYAVLTPEQRVKAEEMHKRMGPPRGMGGPGGPGGPHHQPPPPGM